MMVMSVEALLDWIMDSRGSYYMTPRLDLFSDFLECDGGRVLLDDNRECKIRDLWGPSQVESLGDKRYFLSIVNDYSRRVWIYILRFKHEAFEKFKEWKQLVENQTRKTVKKLRTNNAEEEDTHEPLTYQEAVACEDSSKWKAAMKEEMDSLRKNKTWELVDHQAGQKLVTCKWLFKIKEGIEGFQKPRYKARLVARGFTQRA
nr:retrotransposon protein, putative, Ty1-copia subclass [Tanacetum cinerariifolium]